MNFLRKSMYCLFVGAAVFLAGTVLARAETLSGYREKLERATAVLQNLQQQYVAEKRINGTPEAVREVRQLILGQQKIDLPDGTSLDVDNSWLEANLQQIEQAAPDQRILLVVQTEERLGAIVKRLVELESAQAAATRGKNEDKQKLEDILRRAEYQKPKENKDKSVLERWLDAVGEWWRSLFRDIVPQPVNPGEFQPSSVGIYLRYIVIALAVGLIAFLVWRFVIPLINKNQRRKIKKSNEPRVILGETLAADETADSLLLQAERLAQNGDLRAAIRKGYIAVLAELSDRKVVGLARHKTNRDYLRDVRRREGLYEPMQRLTNSFEQHWYGDTPAQEQDWQNFRSNYAETVRKT